MCPAHESPDERQRDLKFLSGYRLLVQIACGQPLNVRLVFCISYRRDAIVDAQCRVLRTLYLAQLGVLGHAWQKSTERAQVARQFHQALAVSVIACDLSPLDRSGLLMVGSHTVDE
jgi:hypothetical protein